MNNPSPRRANAFGWSRKVSTDSYLGNSKAHQSLRKHEVLASTPWQCLLSKAGSESCKSTWPQDLPRRALGHFHEETARTRRMRSRLLILCRPQELAHPSLWHGLQVSLVPSNQSTSMDRGVDGNPRRNNSGETRYGGHHSGWRGCWIF
jgi:hypothetical protein